MRAPTSRDVEKPVRALLDPPFARLGWQRPRALVWVDPTTPLARPVSLAASVEYRAQLFFSKWNGMAPLPNRCRLDFSGPFGGWPHMALLTPDEQTPIRTLIDDVRARTDRHAFPEEMPAEVRRFFDRQTHPLPNPLTAQDIEMEYLTVSDLEAQTEYLAKVLPLMHARFMTTARDAPLQGSWHWTAGPDPE